MLRSLWTVLVGLVATIGLGLAAMLVSLLLRSGDFTIRAGRLWSAAMIGALGARVSYEGLEHLRAHRCCLFVSNHQSNVDIWALLRVLPVNSRFVAKQSLFRVPFLGWAMAAAGFVPIDRGRRNRAIRSLQLAAQRIQAGHPLVLFAEGTRSRDGTLGPFKKGPFHLAVQAGVPIVPVAISGSGAVLPPRSLRVRPGPVRVRILPPVDVTPFLPGDHNGLRAHVHELVRRGLEETTVSRPTTRTGS